MKNFLVQKLNNTLSHITQRGRLTLLKHVWNPANWDKNTLIFTKKLILDQSDRGVPDEFVEILTSMNRPHVYWKDTKTGLEGEFCIETALTIMTDFLPKLDYTHAPESVLQNKKQLAVLDRHPEMKNNQYVLIDKTHIDNAQLWFYEQGTFYPMVLTYPQYISRAIEVAGLNQWQLFFCEFNANEHHLEQLKQMLNQIIDLFPEINIDEYKTHIQRVKS